MTILITGGAGYIGSHITRMLRRVGFDVLVLDDLSTGFESALLGSNWIKGSIGDETLLESVFERYSISAVMNFASFIAVGESVTNPSKYYRNNVANTLTLLEVMRRFGVLRYIFSSTAAIFGNPVSVPISENNESAPINPYGHSKHMIEQVLDDFDLAYGLKSVSIRYFNAAGADPAGLLGERHNPETHLIPLVLQVAAGRREKISIYGDNYDTPDGTCLRDYVHVQDICTAHLLSLQHLLEEGGSRRYNLGNGTGFSVREVIKEAQQITRRSIPVRVEPRREGDSAKLIADSRLIIEELGWRPKRSDLATILEDAWVWELKWPWQ